MPPKSCAADGGGVDQNVYVPRGGPIYVPDMVVSLTKVFDFELSLVRELQDLREEIGQDLVEIGDIDISVDELKIITEEDLVNEAFEVAFKDEKVTRNSSKVSEEQSDARRIDDGKISGPEENSYSLRSVGGSDAAPPDDSSNGSALCNGSDGELSNTTKTRKRRRHNNQDNDTLDVRTPSAHDHVQELYPEKEIILCVEVYHSRNTWAKTQEFLVLGRQPLSELRDKIYCLTDQVMEKAGQHDPSGYFLIEDVFCNDLREASAIDYSKPILDWLRDSKKEALEKWEEIVSGKLQPKQKALVASKTKPNLPRFKAFQMHKTRFCDLSFRLGAGYLYCHQGDCKHVIVIRDMRLIHPEDARNRFAYPVQTFQLKTRPRKCFVCQIFRAEKVTVDDKWAGENPCYFCGLCYYMLHYVNGSLLYDDFSVYDYYPE